MALGEITDELVAGLEGLRFGAPVAVVYNPLVYARSAHGEYLERFGRGPKEVLFVGMNPGPWGMAQTGVPFGAVPVVRDWMGIAGDAIGCPDPQHPKRPVEGFACRREEVSGSRLWGWAAARFGTPERFFRRFYVTNYCPLVFYDAAGRNLTPDKLRAAERRAVTEPCDRALRRIAQELGVRRAVGVGAFAEARAREALAGTGIEVGRILHPSPASPAANAGWADEAERQLAALGVSLDADD